MHSFFFERWSCRTTECVVLHPWCAISMSGGQQHAIIQFGGAHASPQSECPNVHWVLRLATNVMEGGRMSNCPMGTAVGHQGRNVTDGSRDLRATHRDVC